MDTIEARLSQYVAQTRFEDLSAAAISSARRSTLDTIAAMIAGSSAPGIDIIVKMATGWGGNAEASLVGYGHKLPAPLAAWCNGAMARGLEIDDCVDFLPLHPSASAVPALLALSEFRGGLSGKDFITALAIGQDLVIRLGLAVRLNAMESGRYNLFKIFGPAAAIARAMNLDPVQTQTTLGISFTYGVVDGQCALDGALTLRLQQGIVAQGALISGILASRGFTGAQNFLMGKYGYLVTHEPDPRLEYLSENLGKKYWGEEITIKPFSSCRCTHSGIDLILEMGKEIDLKPDLINQITVNTTPEAHQLVATPHDFRAKPDCAVTAQFSIQYTIAAAIIKGDLFLKELEDENLKDENIIKLADRVKVVPDASLRTDTALGRTVIEVQLNTGEVLRREIESPLGSPKRPMAYEECADKLMKCSDYAIRTLKSECIDELIKNIKYLEEMEDVSGLLAYLS
jgi:2-methylcitrate dehydratase PrpD